MLCTICQTIDFANLLQNPKPDLSHTQTYRVAIEGEIEKLETVSVSKHHETLQDLSSAADAGCPLCATVLAELPESYFEHEFPLRVYAMRRDIVDNLASSSSTGPVVDDSRRAGTPGIEFSVRYRFRGWDGQHWTLPLYITPIAGDAGPLLTHPLPWPTVEESGQNWLRQCSECHPGCLQIQDQPLPTRVLDVDVDNPSQIRLIETNGRKGRYVALSHCWGNRKPIVTNSATYDDHLNGIAFDTLPQTFRDAVAVVRALGYQYLWIDCLCIIQQDADDWHREAARMTSVYANAALTIASCVRDAFVGFLERSSKDPSHKICELDVRWENAASATTIAVHMQKDQFPKEQDSEDDRRYRAPGTYRRRGDSPWQEHLYPEDGQPWSSRAWTLQERLLSHRILYFANGKMFYECNTARFARSCSHAMPLNEEHEDSTTVAKAALHALDPEALMHLWYKVVADYSRRNLTMGQDRFAAISGVARFVAERTRDEYRAGMWNSEFLFGLLWKSSYPIEAMGSDRTEYDESPVSQYQAPHPGPSWSWAACDHGVEYPDNAPRKQFMKWADWTGSFEKIASDVLVLCCDLLDSAIEPIDDEFDSIKRGTLTVIGPMRGLHIEAHYGTEVAVDFSTSESFNIWGEYTSDVMTLYSECSEWKREDHEEPLVFAVPVAVWRKRPDTNTHEQAAGQDAKHRLELEYFAWVLRRDRSDRTVYNRVGSITGSHWKDLDWMLGGKRERLQIL